MGIAFVIWEIILVDVEFIVVLAAVTRAIVLIGAEIVVVSDVSVCR